MQRFRNVAHAIVCGVPAAPNWFCLPSVVPSNIVDITGCVVPRSARTAALDSIIIHQFLNRPVPHVIANGEIMRPNGQRPPFTSPKRITACYRDSICPEPLEGGKIADQMVAEIRPGPLEFTGKNWLESLLVHRDHTESLCAFHPVDDYVFSIVGPKTYVIN